MGRIISRKAAAADSGPGIAESEQVEIPNAPVGEPCQSVKSEAPLSIIGHGAEGWTVGKETDPGRTAAPACCSRPGFSADFQQAAAAQRPV